MVCLQLFVDHVVGSKTADLKYFPFCLGRPPLTLSATPSEFALAVSSPLDKLPFFLFVTEFCNLLIKILFGCRFPQLNILFRHLDRSAYA